MGRWSSLGLSLTEPLTGHLRGTYGKFLEFPEPWGLGSNRPPGRGAERTLGIQTGVRVWSMNFYLFSLELSKNPVVSMNP